MRVPQPVAIDRIRQLSPSVYEVLLRCRARAAWAAHGDRTIVPSLPKALLGSCFHSVVEEANNGTMAGLDAEGVADRARQLFDRRARTLYDQSHPLVRAKFASPEKLPFYNLFRERAAVEALGCSSRVTQAVAAPHASAAATPAAMAERRLESRDGLIVGRVDFIDVNAGEVVDYKTGSGPQDGLTELSDSETRQLRLYVHLALENGMRVSRASIARADGRRASIAVTPEEAEQEAQHARDLLAEYNARVGEQFDLAAQPSNENCQFCSCIPFCEAFWRESTPNWASECGTHVEGRIASIDTSTVQGMRLVTIRIDGQRGTVPTGEGFVEQVPEAWMTADGSAAPSQGDVIRVIYGRLATEDLPHVIRVDRVSTAVWTTS